MVLVDGAIADSTGWVDADIHTVGACAELIEEILRTVESATIARLLSLRLDKRLF